MKIFLISCFAAAIGFTFSACTTVESREPAHTSVTTTEESTVRQPVSATTETQTIRSY